MKAVVLVSGGMDSTTLLHYLAKRCLAKELYALSFHYGQKHSRELAMAEWQCHQLPEVREWRALDLGFFGPLISGASALTDPAIAIPDLASVPGDERGQPITYVPNRNMVLLSIAAAYAESRGCSRLYYGAQAQDEYGYWDCTAEFIARLNHALALNRRTPIEVTAPFAELSKSAELWLGLELGVDYSHTWTCYRGGERACGTCPSCRERLHAFAAVGVPDPLPYEPLT